MKYLVKTHVPTNHGQFTALWLFLICMLPRGDSWIPLVHRVPRQTSNMLNDQSVRRPQRQHQADIKQTLRSGVFPLHSQLANTTKDDTVDILNENEVLKSTVRRLESENSRLQYELSNRIVLESFEGENSAVSAPTTTNEEELWCDVLDENDTCPIEPAVSFGQALKDRATWLVGLLLLQSGSGIILARNEALLANHPVIIYFLTMLVGAGGNAGNQASVRVIRGLALGSLNENTQGQFLLREVKMAGALSVILSLAGFLRTILFRTPLPEAIAVTASLSLIVFSSICLGAILPLVLKWTGVDPVHSSTTIQVVMDILGVVLAVVVSSFLLDTPVGQFIITRLT